jgi:ADP-ribose pyrophosphatase
MEKPQWRRRSFSYLVDSPHLRLRVDEVELPNGTIVPDYYVREARGFVTVVPMTENGLVVLVRQYRYGADSIHLELPAGTMDGDEDPAACAIRELAEETGYEAERWEQVAEYYAEPVRSTSVACVYLALGARKTGEPQLDPTEHLEVELATVDEFRSMLKDGTIDAGASIAAGYRALDYLGRL